MDIIVEEEDLAWPVVPAGVRRQHVLVPPGIGHVAEGGDSAPGIVDESGRLDEDRVGEHVDVVSKRKCLYLGVVGSGDALDDLAVLVLQGSAVLEDGNAVLGVIVEMAGPQHIVVLVLELDDRTAELGEILVYIVSQLVSGQDCLIL